MERDVSGRVERMTRQVVGVSPPPPHLTSALTSPYIGATCNRLLTSDHEMVLPVSGLLCEEITAGDKG
jgi:hypothetical protein